MSKSGIDVIRSNALWITQLDEHEYALKLNGGTQQFEIWRDGFLYATYIEKANCWICEYNGNSYVINWPTFKNVVKMMRYKEIMFDNPDKPDLQEEMDNEIEELSN